MSVSWTSCSSHGGRCDGVSLKSTRYACQIWSRPFWPLLSIPFSRLIAGSYASALRLKMDKILIAFALALFSTGAMGAWTSVGKSDALGVTVYVDRNTIQESGNKVKVRVLNDFETAQEVDGIKYLSVKTQKEFNCVAGLARSLAHAAFSGNMENGKIVNTFDEVDEWRPVKPKSIGELELKAVCGK